MKTTWCSETASKAYIDTVKAVKPAGFPPPITGLDETHVAELVSAMAAGSRARLIVEAWTRGGGVATSIGLAIASKHVGGRHVCVVPDERSRLEYADGMQQAGMSPEVVVGEAEEVMVGLLGVDFLVADCRQKDFAKILRFAKISPRGAVLVCNNGNVRGIPGFRWHGVLDSGTRIVRSAILPVGKGMEIVKVAVGGAAGSGKSRWIRHVDRHTGEEHLFRR